MRCPKCHHQDTKVTDSRDTNDDKEVRRRRECEKCGHRFTTFERIETANFVIIKKNGTRELYNREKVERGLWKACEKRPVTQEQVKGLIDNLEEKWSSSGEEVSTKDIGEGLMDALKKLDEVAYIRFASVYRQFKDVESFKKELAKLIG
ncbi:MAG: transcriptional regulator NrdR [uncultured bacterium]|nr:MAG: transcriptional regulator NrdR [uncultured bacterium]KKT02080.1 MAG: transcriptional regulator NrdR, transcriptional repressor NrdR [Candidatus Peregrinibacteria bacterium GW2011_GWF2_43_17]KKT19427.1 MAG: Transcriptional repressor NrdR [Candidatus Peregrinibacteria bacterium GW2011_GWA2_43_8]HAU40118.1 transcriptional regulator NrdR [Candidatus Peregrinibacteria bacterium]